MKTRLSFPALCLLALALLLPGCGTRPSDCTQPDVFCVGLVTGLAGLDDRSYNQAAWQGLQMAKANGTVDWTASIETVNARDYEANALVFAEAGYDAIVTVGDALGAATYKVARQYPQLYFIGVDQSLAQDQEVLPNLTDLVFPEDQLGFLAGAMAAMMTETGQVGAVCGSDASPAMPRYGEGFRLGAAYVDPAVKVTVIYHNEVGLDKTFNDPEWGAATAGTLIDSGADVIFGVGGETGANALVEAATRGVFGIGADTDQYYALPVAAPRLLTSPIKLITPGVSELLDLVKGAQTRTSIFPAGNYQGQVGLAPYHDLEASIPDQVKARMTLLNQDLASGQVQTGVQLNNP
jgi:basic membrane protein A